ncbi:MAG: MltA domain-containing protein [bacterium]
MAALRLRRVTWIVLFLAGISACAAYEASLRRPGAGGKGEPREEARHETLSRTRWWNAPDVSDDLSCEGLAEAIRQSLAYYGKRSPGESLRFGKDVYTVEEMTGFLERLLAVLAQPGAAAGGPAQALAGISRTYRAGVGGKKIVFTGYYEPVLEGSLAPDPAYPVPLYRVPADMVQVDLGLFRSDLQGMRIVGRYEQGVLVPYHSRHEIDRLGRLAGKGGELIWLKDPVEAFFLHIQGSGRIVLPDGASVRVHYAGSNGRPYRSIGEFLLGAGKMQAGDLSSPALKAYLRSCPEERDLILDQNERYVFFEKAAVGPLGSLSVPLTAGRSVATDSALYPKGALALIETDLPVLDGDGRTRSWKRVRRLVLNQDTGAAIRGPARVDLFWGSGEQAGLEAGCMKRPGRLYFLAPKRE